MKCYIRLHGHHAYNDGVPFEITSNSLVGRKRSISNWKAPSERRLRLRLIQNVKVESLPEALQKATARAQKTEDARRAADDELLKTTGEKVERAWQKAFDARTRARKAWRSCAAKHKKALDKLHRKLCKKDCPWDGHTIFPEARK